MTTTFVSSSSDVVVRPSNGTGETWTVPHAADTTYATHGYFRYIGKFPPQIAAKLLDDYYPGCGPVLDPMVGGGTVPTECLLRGIRPVGWDVNPVSLLISRCVTRRVPDDSLRSWGERVLAGVDALMVQSSLFAGVSQKNRPKPLKLEYCDEYFSAETKSQLAYVLTEIDRAREDSVEVAELLLLVVLASLRRISFANVKKMNLELDPSKKTVHQLNRELRQRFNEVYSANASLPRDFGRAGATIVDRDASEPNWSGSYGMVVMHPPYLTNTAFSEATQLQLAVLGVSHKSIWRKELRCRGSFLHETNGLQKYLTGWGQMIQHAALALADGGRLAVVVGDGQINYVRIPVGAITREFGRDAGLRVVDKAFHVLNNHTGQTQNKKMKGQHVIVFER